MTGNPTFAISLARTFGDNVSEASVLAAADGAISRGLLELGYNQIIVGDGIFAKRRSAETGELLCDSEKFPSGIKALSDALHAKGFTLGVLISLGAMTPCGAPGSNENEYRDAATLAEWGVDHVLCDVDRLPAKVDIQTLIRRMGMALRLTGRSIGYTVYSDVPELHKWVRSTGASAYCCRRFADAGHVTLPDETIAGYTGDYCHNSLGDIMIDETTASGALRSALTLTALMSSPIIVDCDVCALSDDLTEVLKCAAVTAIAGDAELRPARKLSDGVYAKFLDGEKYALAFINDGDGESSFTFYAYDFGLTPRCDVKCAIEPIFPAKTLESDACIIATVAPHDAALFTLTLD